MPDNLKKMKPKRVEGRPVNKLAIIAIAVVVVCGLVLGVVLLAGGSESNPERNITAQEETEETPDTSAPDTSAPTTTPQSTEVTIEDIIVPPLSVYRVRNPFKPLINMEAQEASVSQQDIVVTGGASEGVVRVPPELREGETGTDVASKIITLEGISEENGRLFARIRVVDQLYDKLAVGDHFADYYKLIGVGNDSSATILYGDERFTLFVGQSIYW